LVIRSRVWTREFTEADVHANLFVSFCSKSPPKLTADRSDYRR
jgi:hypothetical protein